MSRYHKGECGPCFICGKTKERRYDHFSGLAVLTQQYIQRHHHDTIPGDSCLCQTHSREALRNLDNSEHIPTWSKQNDITIAHSESTQMCAYPECNASKIQKTLDFLSKGCTCKTGCGTKRCCCRKESRTCGAGCECRGCTNSTIAQQDRERNEENEEEEGDEEDEEDDEDDDEQYYDEEEDDEDEHIQLEVVTVAYIGGDMLII